MIRYPHAIRAFIGLILLTQFRSLVLADTIVLKNGERLDAKITKTTDTTVEAEVKISAGITDVRVFQKTDILGIDKPDPSDAAFEALKAFGPGPNSLTPNLYDEAIRKQLNPFIAQYPNSPQLDAVKQMIAALEQEKARVAQGDVKVENKWYTPAEVDKHKTQIAADLLLQQIKSLAQAGDRLGALNAFGQLEKLYPGSRAFPSAVDYALQLIPQVQRDIDNKKVILRNDMAERQKGLSLLAAHEQAPLIAAAASEDAKIDASIAAAVKAGNKWTPIYPRSAKSIDALQTVTSAEATRLAAIQTGPMHASLAAVQEANKQMASGDLEGATATLQKATTLWAANILLKDATEALTLAKAPPTPTAVPSPTPKTTAKPMLATPPPATATPSPTNAPLAQPSATAALPTSVPPTPTTAPPLPKTASVATPAPEEKASFLMTIPGAVTLLGVAALIAGGISWPLKAKSNREPSEKL